MKAHHTLPSINTPNSGRLGSLLRVPIDYILEVYVHGRLHRATTLPQTPSQYVQARPSATLVTHTIDGVIRELTANHIREITLSGNSGYAQRLGHTRTGEVTTLGGREILEEFDLFLDEYQAQAGRVVQNKDRVYLVFRALNEKQAFKVEPLEWQWTEDASNSRHTYTWNLKLEAYAHAPPSPRKDILSPLTRLLQISREYINVASAGVPLVSNALVNTNSELNEVRRTVGAVGRLFDSLGEVAQGVDGVTSFFTKDLPLEINNATTRFRDAVIEYKELSGSPDFTEWDTLSERLKLIGLELVGQAGGKKADVDRSGTLTIETDSRVSTAVGIGRIYLNHLLREGENAKTLAVSNFGDVERWQEIAEANDLRDATTWRTGRPLRAGDEIKIPVDTAQEIVTASRSDFGVDLEMTLDGDLVLEGNDLAVIRKRKNLEQALRLRILCEQGSAYIMPSYGLPALVGQANTSRQVSFIASHVRDQLEQDVRVREVQDISITSNGDHVDVYVSVVPLSGDALDIVAPYPTN